MKKKILVISSVLPVESCGGEIVLRRHLLGLDSSRWDVHLVYAGPGRKVPNDWPIIRLARWPVPRRLLKTRLAPALDRLIFSGRLVFRHSLVKSIGTLRPDVILTIAHGEMAPLARWTSERFDIPLVSLFHDWWPDIARGTNLGGSCFEKEFLKLFKTSKIALCVSEGMRRELGGGEHASVLLPIPGRGKATSFSRQKASDPVRPLDLAYTGSLGGTYGEMIVALAKSSTSHPDVNFRFCGYHASPGMSSNLPGYLGTLPLQDYEDFVLTNDLLLVTMSFLQTDQRRSRTSFPSKLLEYAHYGRPVLIWGPEDCSAVQWARRTGAAEIVTEDSTEAVFKKVGELRRNPSRLQSLAKAVQQAALNEFRADRIQKQFEAALKTASAPK